MAKELEIKILDIDIDTIKNKLGTIGAKFVSDIKQQIYTYDLLSLDSTYLGIINDLKSNTEKRCISAFSRLKQLFFDIDDLISEFDINHEHRDMIFKMLNYEKLTEYIKQVKVHSELNLSVLDSEEFIEMISKYTINPNKWIRLRKSGEFSSITINQILNRKTNDKGVREHKVNNVLEYECPIESIEMMKEIIEQLGYYHKNYQEKRRIHFEYGEIQIEIDLWPHIPPYLEIEAPNESMIYELVEHLGYTMENVVSMNTDDVYTHYGLDIYSYKELMFKD